MAFFIPGKPERRRWAAFVVLSVFLHGALAAVVIMLWRQQGTVGDDPVQTLMIDMVAMTSGVSEKTSEVKEKTLGVEKKLEPVSRKEVEQKKTLDFHSLSEPVSDDKVSVVALETAARETSAFETAAPKTMVPKTTAPKTTAPKNKDVMEPDTQAGPSMELLAQTHIARVTWHNRLLAHLERYKRYPHSARVRHQEGTPEIRFTLDRDGNVLSALLVDRSEYDVLNEAALELLVRAAPLPAPPSELPATTQTLVVPIRYSLQ